MFHARILSQNHHAEMRNEWECKNRNENSTVTVARQVHVVVEAFATN